MDAKGAVICFQKYVLGREWGNECLTPGGPVCLGYMGRVDVQTVKSFKDFVRIASERGADYACTRKQLLVYQIDKQFDQSVDIVEFDGSGLPYPNDGRLPFCGAAGRRFFALGCCSVLNISLELQDHSPHEVASWLNNRLKTVQAGIRKNGMELEFAIMGLLGGEDLCMISLSDHFAAISEVLSEVEKMTHTAGTETITVVDNAHSMLMVDCAGHSCSWGDTRAQIFFSTRSKNGISYLNNVYQKLLKANMDSKDDISFEGCYGEYDIVIRCPARLLSAELYRGESGLLSYDNPAYQNAVYQSETIVCPFGYSHFLESGAEDGDIPIPELRAADEDTLVPDAGPADRGNSVPDAGLDDTMKQAMKEITRNILGVEEDEAWELPYIRLALYRLLKDYRRIMAYPFNACLHNDLTLQFRTAVNAIVAVSQRCGVQNGGEAALTHEFNSQFDLIINALNDTMLIASQVDRFDFSEQPSYLKNTGSYHKILLAYYGFIKDVLRLLYSVERDTGNRQPLLVPLLSFGLTPIVNSRSFSSYVYEDGAPTPAKLICIKLPYQALANPPKYLGILVHEVFHYLDPPRTGLWNKLLVTCLMRNSICEFTGVLATGFSDPGMEQDYGSAFYRTYSDVIDSAAREITDNIFAQNGELGSADPESLRSVLFQFLDFHRSPRDPSYQFYFQIWRNLRDQFIVEKENLKDAVVQRLFALDQTDHLDRVFADLVKAVEDFYPFRNLLSSCYSALSEVTSDLFDVGAVLHGRSHNEWTKQFFWQIYTTRSDLMLGCEAVEHPDSGLLPANGIRFGIFMDYCLGLVQDKSERMSRFAETLGEWCAGVKEKDRFDRAQTVFRREYQIYLAYDNLYTKYERRFLDMVCAAAESLERDPNCVRIMEKMSGFYWRYCELMDHSHKGGQDGELREKGFDLCIAFIEAYQPQGGLRELKTPSTASAARDPKAGAATPTLLPPLENPPRKYAEYPEELSMAVQLACKEMKVGGKVPLLWYRGQRNKHSTTLPTMLREKRKGEDGSFLTRFRQEVHLARTQILPTGADFTKAEWLAYLQHNEFPTNILDFSEAFYPALYFAIQRWIDEPEKLPEYDSHITLLNPILFNLAMRALDETGEKESGGSPSMNTLKKYLEHGAVEGGIYLKLPLFSRDEEGIEKNPKYKYYFSWNEAADSAKRAERAKRPIAALIPKNSERMRRQSGQFVFYDLRSGMEFPMEKLCEEYRKLVESQDLPRIPFLYEININRFAHKSFVDYAKAIGLRKYHVYPELDKQAKDVAQMVEGY